MESLYSAREVAQVLGVAESRVAGWVRSGLVSPSEKRGARRYFTFTDLIAVKAAKELSERGVSTQMMKKNLAALRGALPVVGLGDRPLLRLRVVSDGERLVVVGDDVAFEPLSRQVVMDFVVGTLSSRAAEVMALPRGGASEGRGPGEGGEIGRRESDAERSAWDWFLEGCALDEEERAAEAEAAFHRALERDPRLAAAHTNLGQLAHRGGRRGEAREGFERALAIDPEQPEARYNLANLLDEIGERERAIEEWRRVTAIAPEFADAHFNLGAALAQRGSTATAQASLARYLELDDSGAWAEAARKLIAHKSGGIRAGGREAR